MTAAAVLSASRLAYPATFLLRSVFSLEDLAGSPIDQMKVLASHALHSFKGLAGCCGIFGEPLLHVLGRVACAQPEPERLCGALGQVGEGGVVPVQGGPVWRANIRRDGSIPVSIMSIIMTSCSEEGTVETLQILR